MSHHLDTPLARRNGRLYIDDLYAFGGDASTVLVMDVNSTITGPDITPGFHPEARYEFKVHVDGAEVEDLTYRLTFDERGGDGQQAYALHELRGPEAHDDAATGTQLLRGRTGEPAVATSDAGPRVWAGRIEDPFYIDLDELSAVNAAVNDGTRVDFSSWTPAKARNSFAGTKVYSIVLEVPHDHPVLSPGTNTGIWCTTKLATDAGGWHQINRAGHPMMWPIFWPTDTDFTNPANVRQPADDANQDADDIADKIAAAVQANGTSADPQGYGKLVANRLFPDVLPYQVATPASYGFAGLNGRMLADNAPETMFSLVLNTATTSGLSPSTNADQRTDHFPYVVPTS